MCGSGTLPIEAALIAADIAPGLLRAGLRLSSAGSSTTPMPGRRYAAAAEARRQVGLLTPGPHPRLRPRPGRDPRCRGERRARGPRQAALPPALRAREAAGRAGAHRPLRREPALRRAHRRDRRTAQPLRAARRAAARRLPRLGGGRLHGQPGARPRARHQRAAHAPHDERADRVPAAAAAHRACRVRAGARARPAAGDRRRGGARAARRADVREPPEEEPGPARGLGPSARRSPATASTTPTCRSTRSRSTCTSRTRREARAAGCTCRSTRRPRRSTRTRRGRAARKRSPCCPRCTGLAAECDLLAHAPPAEGQLAVRGDGGGGRARGRRGGRAQVPGQLHGLPRHGPVPRPPADARADPDAGEGQALPQPLLLHRRGDGVRGRGRRGVDDQHRHVAHLRRVGEAQPRGQRHCTARNTSSSRRTASPGWRRRGRNATTSSSSTRRPSRTPSAWTASSTCSATTSTSSARR